jgi:Ca-activated chloride channel family protein
LILSTSILSGQAWAKAQEPQFHISVDAVYLDVVVVDTEGRFWPGLTADDFEVIEAGVPQELSYFTDEETPVTVLLLLDASSSIQRSLKGVKSAAINFLRRLSFGDKAALAFFNHNLRFATPFTDDQETLARGVKSMRAGGLTALYDSVLTSLDRLSELEGRKALLVFSDGADSWPAEGGSEATMKDAFEGGRRSDASVYAIGFLGAMPQGYGVNRGFLKRLARESGGRAFFPKGTKELNRTFTQIHAELSSQYRMAYVPRKVAKNGEWRNIEVRIKGTTHLLARTRAGYYGK